MERTNRNRADLIDANGRGSNSWFPPQEAGDRL
jgi:hypothetical protein